MNERGRGVAAPAQRRSEFMMLDEDQMADELPVWCDEGMKFMALEMETETEAVYSYGMIDQVKFVYDYPG